MTEVTPMDEFEVADFRFYEYNHRRAMRGAEAVRMEIISDRGDTGLLWMSKRDIENNIREFGAHPELQKGLDAYRSPPTTHGGTT